jgi:hypothetical protein
VSSLNFSTKKDFRPKIGDTKQANYSNCQVGKHFNPTLIDWNGFQSRENQISFQLTQKQLKLLSEVINNQSVY